MLLGSIQFGKVQKNSATTRKTRYGKLLPQNSQVRSDTFTSDSSDSQVRSVKKRRHWKKVKRGTGRINQLMDSSTDQLMDSLGSFLDGKILQKKAGDFMHFHENITDGWGEPVDRQTD